MKSSLPVMIGIWMAAATGPASAGDAFSGAEHYTTDLAGCYAQVLEQNPDVRRARLDFARATGTRIVFRARALPRATFRAEAGQTGGPLYGSGGPFALARVDLSQPLFDMGMAASVRRGQLEVAVAEQELNRVTTEQLHKARLAFVEALLCRQLLELHRQVETHLEASVESTRRRIAVGTASQQAAQRAETQLLNLRSELTGVQSRYFDAVTRLAGFTGQPVVKNGTLRLPEPSGGLEYALPVLDLEKESARTLQHRPDILILRELIAAAAEDQRMGQAGYYPLVTAVAVSQLVPQDSLFLRRPEIVPGQDLRNTETRYGAALTWQMIDNGRVTGAIRRVENGRAALATVLRRLEDNVPRELAAVARTLDSVDARVKALKQSASLAEEALKLSESRAEQGEATHLEILNAQNNLLGSRAGLLQAVFENEAARAEFDRLSGRYLDLSTAAPK